MKQQDFNDFLSQAIEEKRNLRSCSTRGMTRAFRPATKIGVNGHVSGNMDCSDIAVVDLNAGMSTADYSACSMVMAVCQNMIQKTISDAASEAHIEAVVALKNMDA